MPPAAIVVPANETPMEKAIREAQESGKRKRMLGNMRFIGELMKKGISFVWCLFGSFFFLLCTQKYYLVFSSSSFVI